MGVFAYLWRHAAELSTFEYDISPTALVLSIMLIALAIGANLCAWIVISTGFGIAASTPHAARTWLVSRLGRYVPGKFAIFILRFQAYPLHSKQTVTVATVTELAGSILAASLILVTGALTSTKEVLQDWIIPFSAVALCCAVLVHPKVLSRGLKALRVPSPTVVPTVPLMLRVMTLQAIGICLHGLSLYFLLNSIDSVLTKDILFIIIVYFAAGLAGILAVFAPSGVGVREGVLLMLLPEVASVAAAAAATFLIRILLTCVEVTLVGLVCVLYRTRQRSST